LTPSAVPSVVTASVAGLCGPMWSSGGSMSS
jgi:hypothetical protein